MESVIVFYSIGVEYEVHSSGVAPEDGTGANLAYPVEPGLLKSEGNVLPLTH